MVLEQAAMRTISWALLGIESGIHCNKVRNLTHCSMLSCILTQQINIFLPAFCYHELVSKAQDQTLVALTDFYFPDMICHFLMSPFPFLFLSSNGRLVAILQDTSIEIRSSRDEYETLVGKCNGMYYVY